MKNKLGKILSILTILALVMIPTVQAANKIQIGEKISYYGILGDVNRDGKINSQDSKLVLQYSTGTRRLTIFQKKRADVNQDGKINSQDSILILKYESSSNTNTNQSNKVNVSSIKISGATEMYKGETKKLTATIEPNNATDKQIKWSSSSDVRATVDQNGNVTAKSSGTVKITAKAGERSATHRIVIKERKVQVTKINIIKNPTKMSYNLNDKLDTTGMKIKVTYSDGTTEEKTKGFSATPTQLTKTGKQEITVKYSGLTAKLKVSVGAISRLGTATISAINSTAITGGMDTNKGNTAWVVKNCVSNANVTGIKINANKNYVSSGAICLYFANQILKQGNNSVINYQVAENGKYVSWRTDWVKGNYGGQDFASFEQQMNKICQELSYGNPVAIPVNDENGNFRYVLAYAITKPKQASPKFTAKDIYVIDPTIGGWSRLSNYYQFMENGKIVYRATCLSRTAVTKITMENSKTLNKGGTVNLTAKCYNARGIQVTSKLKEVIWTSSNTKVATVDRNGKVTAKGAGTATITAKAKYSNSNATATCKVTVKGVSADAIVSSAKKMWQHTERVGGYRYDDYYTTSDVRNMWDDHKMCCASFVAWVLYDSGVMSYQEINKGGFNGAYEICKKLFGTGKFDRTYLENPSTRNLKPGDIVYWSGHVQIYEGNGMWYNGGSNDENNCCQNTSWAKYGLDWTVYRLK